MAKINFKELQVKTTITGDKTITLDVSAHFANVLYEGMNGIAAHDLAFKIFRSEGEIELDEKETALMTEAMNIHCTPKFIDAVQTALNKNDNG